MSTPDYIHKKTLLLKKALDYVDHKKYDEAAEFLIPYALRDKKDFHLHHIIGTAYALKADPDNTKIWLEKALDIDPHHIECLGNLGQSEKNAGRLAMAKECFERILALEPNNALAAAQVGDIALKTGDIRMADAYFKKALELKPDDLDLIDNYLILQINRGEFVEALDVINKRMQNGQKSVRMLLILATVLHRMARYDDNLAVYEEMEQDLEQGHLEMNSILKAEFYASYGYAFFQMGQEERAFTYYQKALETDTGYKITYLYMALYYYRINDLEKMNDYFAQSTDGSSADAYVRYWQCNIYRELGLVSQALSYAQDMLRLNSESKEFKISYGLTALCAGHLEEGWRYFEERVFTGGVIIKPKTSSAAWDGSIQKGASLLIYGEQGIGDEIEFATLIPEVAALFSHVVFACHHKLVTVFARSFPQVVVVPHSQPEHPLVQGHFDYHVALGSLPQFFRKTPESFRPVKQILSADPLRLMHWKNHFASLGPGLKVGIAWRSVKVVQGRSRQYPSIEAMGPIFSIPGVHFINIQYTSTEEELQKIQDLHGVALIQTKQIDHFNDIDASACVIGACDLVICPGISTSSLAAGLGVPTILLMGMECSYLNCGFADNPWLSSFITLFKKITDPWEPLMDRVAFIVGHMAQDYWTRQETQQEIIQQDKILS